MLSGNISIQVIIKAILSVFFIGCLFDLPYFYFQFVRVIGMTGFVLLAYFDRRDERDAFAIIWICSAIIINPIFKVPLGRTLWNVIDIIWVILFIATIVFEKIIGVNKLKE